MDVITEDIEEETPWAILFADEIALSGENCDQKKGVPLSCKLPFPARKLSIKIKPDCMLLKLDTTTAAAYISKKRGLFKPLVTN